MWRVAACCVPHFQTRELKGYCIEICHEWVKMIDDELEMMVCVIIGDESWISV